VDELAKLQVICLFQMCLFYFYCDELPYVSVKDVEPSTGKASATELVAVGRRLW
jgi:hypothetical protein